jgi:hypothetical protein
MFLLFFLYITQIKISDLFRFSINSETVSQTFLGLGHIRCSLSIVGPKVINKGNLSKRYGN